MLEFIIVGAGPAGLQMGYYLQKSNRSYTILEKGAKAGSFFASYPRHRRLISINKVYTGHEDPEINLRWDWNSLLCDDPEFTMGNYTEDYFPNADYLVRYLNDFADKYQLNIAYDSEAVHIKKSENTFVVTTADGAVYKAKHLIMGTGTSKPYIPPIKGIELCENYMGCSIDLNDYKNKRVLVIGKGNSGFELANHLISVTSLIHVVSPRPITMAWDTHFVGHLRAVNNNLLDTYQLKSQNAIIDAELSEIKKEGDKLLVEFHYSHADGEIETRAYDHVLVATGFRFDHAIFAGDIKPALDIDDRFPKQTETWESTNISGLYFIGALTQQRSYKKSTSSFIHGFRYNAECLSKILEKEFYGNPIPHQVLPNTVEDFTKTIMKRINISSSLWQQFGYLCDVLTVDAITKESRYYDTLPLDYIKASESWKQDDHFVLTMEFGKVTNGDSTFAISRVKSDDVANGDKSIFLHPIVRYYSKGELMGEFHMIEDLEADYTSEELHINPLRKFLDKHLSKGLIQQQLDPPSFVS